MGLALFCILVGVYLWVDDRAHGRPPSLDALLCILVGVGCVVLSRHPEWGRGPLPLGWVVTLLVLVLVYFLFRYDLLRFLSS